VCLFCWPCWLGFRMARGWHEDRQCASMDGEEVSVPLAPCATTLVLATEDWPAGDEPGYGGAPVFGSSGLPQASWPSCLKESGPASLPTSATIFGSCNQTLNASMAWSSAPVEGTFFHQKRRVATQSVSPEDGVAALLPKMKRMRLRPSLGQLRLQLEADDANDYPLEVKLTVEPEQLRASVIIEICELKSAGGPDLVYLDLSFPPQYPHRPPKICQVSPNGYLPFWRYEGQFVILERLSERKWSSAMGVSDILNDLLRPLGLRSPGGLAPPQVVVASDPEASALGDVEMA
jgi:ubiquitin-protein ligase